MGYWKQHKQREVDRRRERRSASRSLLETDHYAAILEAMAFFTIDVPGLWRFTKEAIMALDDLFDSVPGINGAACGTAEDDAFCSRFPTVWSLCTHPVDGAGKPRMLATLLFFIEAGAWKVRLAERNHRLDLWAGGDTFDAAMETLEAMLMKRPVPWRKAAAPPGKK